MRYVMWSLVALGAACGTESDAARVPNEQRGTSAESPSLAPVPGQREPSPSGIARPVVLIIGTSLTAGYGLNPYYAYPAVLQRMADSVGYKVDIIAAGVSGETSAGALRRIDWLMRRRADVIVVETGANDGLRGLDIDSTTANLRAIVRRARRAKPEAMVFLVQMEAPPNLGERYTTRFRAMFPAVAREEGAALIPFLLDGVAGVAGMNLADGIHPNERGSLRVAANVWPPLEYVLRQLGRSARE